MPRENYKISFSSILKHSTIIVTLTTVYTYICTYEYQLGSCYAYKIPEEFIAIGATQLIKSAITVIVFIFIIIYVIDFFTVRVIKQFFNKPPYKNLAVLFFFNTIVYFTVKYLTDTGSVHNTVIPIVFFLICIYITFQLIVHWIKKAIIRRKAHRTGSNEQRDINANTEITIVNEEPPSNIDDNDNLFLYIIIIVLVIFPLVVNKLGYQRSKESNYYSVIANKPHAKTFAIVKRFGELTFARSYKDSTFTDSLLILNNNNLDTLKLLRKKILFRKKTTITIYEQNIQKVYHLIGIGR